MKKNTKRLLSLMLSLILVVGLIPGSLMTAHAAGSAGYFKLGVVDGATNTWNVKISDAGVLSWDAQGAGATYEIWFAYTENGHTLTFVKDLSENSCDLKKVFEDRSIENGTYYFCINAKAGGTSSSNSIANYYPFPLTLSYVSSLPKLAEPQNLSWDGTTAKWDSVPNATGYDVYIYDTNGTTPNYRYGITATEHDFGSYAKDGRWFEVVAVADGYRDSNVAESPKFVTTYTITATAGEGGTITPSGEVKVNKGEGYGFAIEPNEGYKIKDVIVDGTSVGVVTAYGFSDVEANHTIEAVFETTSVTPPKGDLNVIESNGVLTWPDYPGATHYALSITGYAGLDNNIESGFNLRQYLSEHGKPYGEYTYSIVARDDSLAEISNKHTATYNYQAAGETPEPTEYNITVTGGTASVGAGTAVTKATAGTVITLTVDESAIPAGKVFDKWEVVSGGVTVTDGKFTMPESAVEINATYKDAPVSHTCDIKPVAKDEPSCTEGGKEAYYKCDGCGKCYEDALGAKEITDINAWGNLEKLGHTESDWKSDKDNHWKECTVTACGVIIEDSKAAHKDDNKDGKCDVCEYNVGVPGDSSDDDKPSDNPQTDDNSMIWLWCALLFVSGAGVVATVYGKKRSSVK